MQYIVQLGYIIYQLLGNMTNLNVLVYHLKYAWQYINNRVAYTLVVLH